MTTKEFIAIPKVSKDFETLENIYGYVSFNQDDTILIGDFTTEMPKEKKVAALVEHDYNGAKENLGINVIMQGEQIIDYYYY